MTFSKNQFLVSFLCGLSCCFLLCKSVAASQNNENLNPEKKDLDYIGSGFIKRFHNGQGLGRNRLFDPAEYDLVKEQKSKKDLDYLGTGFIKRDDDASEQSAQKRVLDPIGSGFIKKRLLDPIGSGFIKRGHLDRIGSGFIKRGHLDRIGSGFIKKSQLDYAGKGFIKNKRPFDAIGAGFI